MKRISNNLKKAIFEANYNFNAALMVEFYFFLTTSNLYLHDTTSSLITALLLTTIIVPFKLPIVRRRQNQLLNRMFLESTNK